jgi:hypothetical protein
VWYPTYSIGGITLYIHRKASYPYTGGSILGSETDSDLNVLAS